MCALGIFGVLRAMGKKEGVCTVRVYRGMTIDRVVLTVLLEQPNCDQVAHL
jgi:hypothetical protein